QSKSVLPIQRQPIGIMPKATAPVVPVLLKVGATGSGAGGNRPKATAPVVPVLFIDIKKKYAVIVKTRKIFKL
ncbi:hypothetical protein, partial [Flavobacterium sp.]|uniref:hypothetical protein n=1 Tax=Flavobacterium sp. TaxID=239 RepID=UPI003751DE9D